MAASLFELAQPMARGQPKSCRAGTDGHGESGSTHAREWVAGGAGERPRWAFVGSIEGGCMRLPRSYEDWLNPKLVLREEWRWMVGGRAASGWRTRGTRWGAVLRRGRALKSACKPMFSRDRDNGKGATGAGDFFSTNSFQVPRDCERAVLHKAAKNLYGLMDTYSR